MIQCFVLVICLIIGIQPTVFIDPGNVTISATESTSILCCAFGLNSDQIFTLTWKGGYNRDGDVQVT